MVPILWSEQHALKELRASRIQNCRIVAKIPAHCFRVKD
jgi:hypothetical protein